jgi:hypothetical protein
VRSRGNRILNLNSDRNIACEKSFELSTTTKILVVTCERRFVAVVNVLLNLHTTNNMSGWDPNFAYNAGPGQPQGFYNPSAPTDAPSFYGNYGTGSDSAYAPTAMNFMTPAPLGDGPYDATAESDEFANEPPLLEELGINPEHIFQKTLAVLNPFRATRPEVAGDSDLAGPLV